MDLIHDKNKITSIKTRTNELLLNPNQVDGAKRRECKVSTRAAYDRIAIT
jgi:hypothetical protein